MRYIALIVVVVLLILGLVLYLGPCSPQRMKAARSHFKSGIWGLNRQITWSDGFSTTKVWRGNFKVEYDNGYARFITDDGRTVTLGPNICIEEVGK